VLRNFEPGYINQLPFVVDSQPDKVLLSIGGNDIGFSKILRRCLEPDTCYSTYEDRLELLREINGSFSQLVDTYTKIKQEGLPEAKIYAVGYPQIAKPNGKCGLNVHLNAQELEFGEIVTDYLNLIIQRAATKAGVIYADTQAALPGHRLCEADKNNIAVHGLTAGDNTPSFLRGPIGNESYHPNQLGHRLLTKAILDDTFNLTKQMPVAVPNSEPPAEIDEGLLDVPRTNRAINQVNYDADLTNDIVYREVWWDIYVKALNFSLKKLNPFKIVLNSEPTDLGTFTTDTSGNLSAQIRIPATVPTGFHTLHAYGTNMAGESIDIYKTIYVAANESDYDGDGLPNTADSCDTLPNSGVDSDQDGVDDACDGAIGLTPVTSVTSSAVLTEDEAAARNESSMSEQDEDADNSVQTTISANTLQGRGGDDISGAVLTESTSSDDPTVYTNIQDNSSIPNFETRSKFGLIIASLLASLLALLVSKAIIRTWRTTLHQRRHDAMTS